MNEQIRSLFPALEELNYLNCAAVAPLPRPAIEAVNRQLVDVSLHGSSHYPEWVATKNCARELVAQMMSVRADQIAFMRNTSDGFASVAAGIDWDPQDNIVSFEREFPANYYAWRNARDRYGIELRLCPERNGRIDLDEFVGLIDRNTKLVSISAIQFATGFLADLERIGRAARDVDALFAVDIIQAMGTRPFDLPSQYVDIACGASHKWLCAPEGCGIIYLGDRARDRLKPMFVGWISVLEPWDFLDLEQDFKPNALAWESGTGCSSLFYGLEQSLEILLSTGLGNIESHLDGLSGMLCDSVDPKKYRVVSSREPGESSQIVCLEPVNGKNSDEIFKELESNRTIVSSRNGVLRVSPHFFNTEADISALVEVLP